MFSKKHFVIFISKQSIDTGFVIVGREVSFESDEAFSYTKETLADILKKIQKVTKKSVRIVLGEELVYTVVLSLPKGTILTRALVREKAEEIIPEDFKDTEWDFQTLRYKELSHTGSLLVQVAVIEKAFSQYFHQAVQESSIRIESVVSESYILASLENERKEVSIIVERDREIILLCAVESGHPIASCIKRRSLESDDIKIFLDFLSSHKEKKVQRIIFSHFEESEQMLSDQFSLTGYEVEKKNYNPLIGAGLQEKISGKDEEVFNILALPQKKQWWKIW